MHIMYVHTEYIHARSGVCGMLKWRSKPTPHRHSGTSTRVQSSMTERHQSNTGLGLGISYLQYYIDRELLLAPKNTKTRHRPPNLGDRLWLNGEVSFSALGNTEKWMVIG